MKIREILREKDVVAQICATDKAHLLDELADVLARNEATQHIAPQTISCALKMRESLGSTGVGEGIAIPHAKLAGLRQILACFGRSNEGIEFDSIDNRPVTLIFVLLVPENSTGLHLKALARVSRLLKKEAFREQLSRIDTSKGLYDAFVAEDDAS